MRIAAGAALVFALGCEAILCGKNMNKQPRFRACLGDSRSQIWTYQGELSDVLFS